MSVSCRLSFSTSSHLISVLAVKGVSYTTLIRLGIMWGKGPGAFEKGVFGVHWGCHPLEHVKILYDDIAAAFTRKPHGPFDALTILIGENNARTFAINLGLPVSS